MKVKLYQNLLSQGETLIKNYQCYLIFGIHSVEIHLIYSLVAYRCVPVVPFEFKNVSECLEWLMFVL